AAIRRAYDAGINYFDLAAGKAEVFSFFGEALKDVREHALYQIHFGADYTTGDYGWTTDENAIRRSVEWQLKSLSTDYIDYGFIHCLDEESDWNDYKHKGALKALLEMKEQGVVRHLGLSSHTPSMVQTVLKEVPLDMLMFSINPAYDFQMGKHGKGSADERNALYRRCAAEGIGISVMKPFAGGQLLDASLSPFGRALTNYQCMQYVLDRPGVLTVLPGAASMAQLEDILGFLDAADREKDYSVIGSFQPAADSGKCVYCNHCKPCPVGLEVGLINKYYDLAKNGDAMAAEHYKGLQLHAEDCIGCGHCNSRCPFGVDQVSRMQQIKEYFIKQEADR
ncbi:MAG: aldo/keto reductase, partial [Firmicutes bacterium]|nr:aldo/keto reductase [Bacillota bacterium]